MELLDAIKASTFNRFTDLGDVIKQAEVDKSKICIQNGYIEMLWGGYAYEISLERINDWAGLTDWILHLCSKSWMTPHRLRLFAEAVIKEKGWKRSNS
jgi:hypothetical protein